MKNGDRRGIENLIKFAVALNRRYNNFKYILQNGIEARLNIPLLDFENLILVY